MRERDWLKRGLGKNVLITFKILLTNIRFDLGNGGGDINE